MTEQDTYKTVWDKVEAEGINLDQIISWEDMQAHNNRMADARREYILKDARGHINNDHKVYHA